MGPSPGSDTAGPSVPDPAPESWINWLHAHANAQPGCVQAWEWLACVTPAPPRTPLPPWLLGTLFPDQELILRRVELWRRPEPGFRVVTSSGRDLGLILGPPAAMIELALSEGITPRVSVAIASVFGSAGQALRLSLDVMVWSAPGDQRGTLLRPADRRRHSRDRAVVEARRDVRG